MMRGLLLLMLCGGTLAGCGDKPAPDAEAPAPATEKPTAPLVKAPLEGRSVPMPNSFRVNGASVETIAIKNGSAEVKGVFKSVSGKLGFGGTKDAPTLSGTVEVDLSSYNSGLELRDQRVQDLFFEAAQHGTAVLKLKNSGPVPGKNFPMGEPTEISMKGTLTMHGAEAPVETTLVVRRTSPIDIKLETKEPLHVSIADFGMNGQLQALIKACAHQSVGDDILVNASVSLSGAPTGNVKVPPPPRAEMYKRKAKVKIQQVQ